jgi:hypothetical protein
MRAVKVIFSDSQYNYITDVNGERTDEEIERYFVGKYFNMGVYPNENMQQCTNIKINNHGTV